MERARWDIVFTDFSLKWKYRVTGYNEDARIVIQVTDTASGKPIPMPDLPEGQILGVTISRDETTMAYYLNDDRSPSNLYAQRLGATQAKRLTDTLSKQTFSRAALQIEIVFFHELFRTEDSIGFSRVLRRARIYKS